MDLPAWRSDQLRDCLSKRCQKGRCSLGLKSLSREHLTIIDCDKYQRSFRPQGRLSDFLLFEESDDRLVVCVVELKGGDFKAKEARDQIVGTARVAEELAGGRLACDFVPILLYRRRAHSQETKMLRDRKSRVRFRGRDEFIIVENCGTQLKDILARFVGQGGARGSQ